ncbi:hypothetical protein X971_5395 (plasmid) [Agrobacterium tumefaciens LBA4213 (Ach5)]|nr:hypothetical protein X971_5395 [Agrobacterium tumefaciens LBA4213 (Ach5)]
MCWSIKTSYSTGSIGIDGRTHLRLLTQMLSEKAGLDGNMN